MNSRERMLSALSGAKTDKMPVGAHAWGLYKFQLAGLLDGYEDEDTAWATGGGELARIEENYYDALGPDFLHLSEGPCVYPKHKMQAPVYKDLMGELRQLDSKDVIDTFVKECYPDPEEYLSSTRFEHVKILSQKLGEEVFIALHSATPVNDVFDSEGFLGGFQEAMIAAYEKTDMVAYLIYKSHMKHTDYQKALVKCGAHAYITTDGGYLSSDLVSPPLYEKLLFETQIDYYKEVRKTGLVPIMCFWGNINPLIGYFKQLDIDGLMIEEARKGYEMDAAEIKRELGGGITLFGNLSGEGLLLKGTPEEVAAGTRKMIGSLDNKERFIMCTGTPIAFDTPAENLRAMFDAARGYAV